MIGVPAGREEPSVRLLPREEWAETNKRNKREERGWKKEEKSLG